MNFFNFISRSIKNLINTLFAVIIILLLVFGILLIKNSLNTYLNQVSNLETSNRIALLNLGTIELSLERSVSQLALNIPAPILGNFEMLIKKQRELGTPKIEEAIELISKGNSFDNKSFVLDKLKTSLYDLNELRKTVDRNTSVPIEKRDLNFINKFPFTFPTLIEEILSTKFALKVIGSEVDSISEILDLITQYAWEIRDYGGRERTYFAIAIFNKTPISPEISERMFMLNRRVEFAWRNLVAIRSNKKLPKEIIDSINKIERSYLTDYKFIRETLISESSKGQYTIEFNEFFQRSAMALADSENLAKEGIELQIKLSENGKNSSLISLITLITSTLLAIILCLYLMHYLNLKIVGNIIRVTNILDSLSKGNKEVDYSGFIHMENEIGSLIHSSKAFRDNLLKIDKLIVEQSSAVNETTHVVEMLDKSSKLSAERASEVANISQSVLKSAHEGEKMVDQMKKIQSDILEKVLAITEQIKLLEVQTNQIGSITDSVSELAKQTNMLALNAAVEASRAGEFGRGFAVVSIEIRKLSDESKNSANKIQGLIDDIKKSVKKTVGLSENGKEAAISGSDFADTTSVKFKEVAFSIENVSDNISSIAINLRQQVSAHEEVLLAMNSLNSKTRQLADF